jgi:hypothetical protein
VRLPGPLAKLNRRQALTVAGGFALGVAVILAFVFRDDILQTALDPRVPFQTYEAPRAPDYSRTSAWALWPGPLKSGDGPADIFFIHPTTFNGGEEWNGPITSRAANRRLSQVMLPNYAGPFLRVGRVFAPRYRQASLYTQLTPREDAREARRFAYADIQRAFRAFLAASNGRPVVVVGVEQGGSLADLLVRSEIAKDPALRARLAAAYMIYAVVPAAPYGAGSPTPACTRRDQAGCVVAYMSAPERDEARAARILRRALVWNGQGYLEPLAGRPALCVNPLLGAATDTPATESANLGAVNASDMEWGLRPAFLPHQVAARCKGGVLRVTRPSSPTLQPARGWAERLKAPQFNVFWADLEADAGRRVQALVRTGYRPPAPPITVSIPVRKVPTHRMS